MSFKKFEANIQSQFGEDGVIEEIFNRIGCTNKICVEFGAWDGVHLSNTWNLWANKGWSALLIEGDKAKYEILKESTKTYENVNPYLAYVTPEGESSLESILVKVDYPKDIDLISIDIDGDDYYIFESLTRFIPRIAIVEYNPTIPPSIDLVQAKGEYLGCSALSLLKLAHEKAYKLVHMTDTNMFFAHQNVFDKLQINEPELSEVFVKSHLLSVFSSYDGRTFLVGTSPYSNFEVVESEVKHPLVLSDDSSIKAVIVKQSIQRKNPFTANALKSAEKQKGKAKNLNN